MILQSCYGYYSIQQDNETPELATYELQDYINGTSRPSKVATDHTQAHTTFEDALTAVCKAINSTVHTTLNATPTQLVFRRDTFLPVGFEADWSYIATRKQRLVS